MSTIKATNAYLAHIKRFPLRPIRDEETLDAASDIYSELILKANRRTSDEDDYLTVLGRLIREFEESTFPTAPRMTPERALASLMEDNKLGQSEIARELQISQSAISEFLSGKRGLSKAIVLKLANRFKVSPELFLKP